MNLRPRRAREPDINLTSLIDVVFLLLIFFMVSTTFNREAELSIALPEASAPPAEPREAPLEVAIDAKGRFYVNGRQLVNTQMKSVVQAMREAAGAEKDPQVVISADAQTPHQAVITVMDAARRLGFVRLSFPTRGVEEGDAQRP